MVHNKELTSTITTMKTRRPQLQHPPTPRILNLPRRPRLKLSVQKSKPGNPGSQRDSRGKLEVLFDQEREFTRGRALPIVTVRSGGEVEELRERVLEEKVNVVDGEEKMEKWRFQAEMLRAECKLLRMEREIAIKKMERRRVLLERTLRSALRALLSGKQRISDAMNHTAINFQEELQGLAEKFEKLLRILELKHSGSRRCCNFDRQASVLRSRLQKYGGDSNQTREKEIQEMPEASFSAKVGSSANGINGVTNNSISNNNPLMDVSRREKEGVSNGTRTLLERIREEYEDLIIPTTTCSAPTAASSSKRVELPKRTLSSTRQACKGPKPCEEKACSGCCKDIVRRVAEQVRAETEQWSQMQEMLGQVRDEMEELQVSRDFWEAHALKSDARIQSLCSAVEDWKQRALSSEAKLNELRIEASILHTDLQNLKKETETARSKKNLSPVSRDMPSEKEKRILHCRFKENRVVNDDKSKNKEAFTCNDGSRKQKTDTSGRKDTKLLPLKDIGNTAPLLVRQKSRAVFPLPSSRT